MRKRFVVSFGMILLMLAAGISARAQAGNHIAGFDTRWIKDYEPSREDGVSMVGEPDWDAEFEKAGPALAAGELAASVGQVLVTAGEAQESSGEDGGAAEPGAAGEESGTEADTEAETDAQEAAADGWVRAGAEGHGESGAASVLHPSSAAATAYPFLMSWLHLVRLVVESRGWWRRKDI